MSNFQSQASNPDYSVWVAASAGTGKTKILTDRVLRLLLKKVHFNKILCLTFTNAAATEMHNRISDRLYKWAKFSNNELSSSLFTLLSRKPKIEELKLAKDLYEIYLSLNHKIPIYTIHSFCQKILKRFPIEAGVSSSFQILDDIKLRQIISKTYNILFSYNEPDEVIEFFTCNFHSSTIESILLQILESKLKFKHYLNYNGTDFKHLIMQQNLIYEKNEILFKQKLVKFIGLLNHQAILKDESKILELYNIIISNKQNNIKVKLFHDFFLTKNGEKRKTILTTKIKKKFEEASILLDELQQQFFLLNQIEILKEIYIYSDYFIKLSKSFIKIYEEQKNQLNFLDFDDLIYFTNKLLADNEAKEWVLYKLDGGIEHILIDEAQDTSQHQWNIIQNLIQEFYSGQGSSYESKRTIFVVGDEKQSIFSFQGADLTAFYTNHKYFQEKLISARKKFQTITLQYSYRSLGSILEIVFNIFNYIKNVSSDAFISENTKLLPFRFEHNGIVELWPLVKSNNKNHLFWPTISDHIVNQTPETLLAQKIAKYIQNIIDNKIILPSTGKEASFEDFLIIVRKRDKLATEIINQLKIHDLDTTGIDRLLISENITVLDLISIAKFVLAPYDNLNLATLLKSPIIGLNDKEIEFVQFISSTTLWEKLKIYNHSCIQILCNFLELYKFTNVENFFHYIVDYLSYRKILNSSEDNGGENDAINELLYISYNYSKSVNKSLLDFIYWFEENEVEIKRNVESTKQIRLMTAHNAKGLQAPVVILCDTTSIPVNQDKFFWTDEGDFISSSPNSKNSDFFYKIKSKCNSKEFKEYLRLLYVSLTRAEDRLIICGTHSDASSISENSWYHFSSKAFQDLDTETTVDDVIIYQGNSFTHSNTESSTLLIKTPDQTVPIINNKQIIEDINNPLIAFEKKNKPTSIEDINNISKLSNNISNFIEENFIYSKIDLDDLKNSYKSNNYLKSPLHRSSSLKYGKLLHKILEDSVKIKDLKLIYKHPLKFTLSESLQIKLENTACKLINNTEFSLLLAQTIKTEINIGMNYNNKIEIGRIDLMAIQNNNITIIDYKSDANPPHYDNIIPPNYISQLNNYRKIIQALYPTFNIICKILWLETGEFSIIHNTECIA